MIVRYSDDDITQYYYRPALVFSQLVACQLHLESTSAHVDAKQATETNHGESRPKRSE